MKISTLFFIALLGFVTAEEERKWSNSEGTKHFNAEFIERTDNQVTLLRKDGKKLTFEISKLHKDDQTWLDLTHPLKGKEQESVPDKKFVFDTSYLDFI